MSKKSLCLQLADTPTPPDRDPAPLLPPCIERSDEGVVLSAFFTFLAAFFTAFFTFLAVFFTAFFTSLHASARP